MHTGFKPLNLTTPRPQTGRHRPVYRRPSPAGVQRVHALLNSRSAGETPIDLPYAEFSRRIPLLSKALEYLFRNKILVLALFFNAALTLLGSLIKLKTLYFSVPFSLLFVTALVWLIRKNNAKANEYFPRAERLKDIREHVFQLIRAVNWRNDLRREGISKTSESAGRLLRLVWFLTRESEKLVCEMIWLAENRNIPPEVTSQFKRFDIYISHLNSLMREPDNEEYLGGLEEYLGEDLKRSEVD